jgi:hypothetical protein
MSQKGILKTILVFGLRACIESSEGLGEWGVYLINTIKNPFEGFIADIRNKWRFFY